MNKTKIVLTAIFFPASVLALLIWCGELKDKTKTLTQKMHEKIDSVAGKLIYRRRMATVELVFADAHCGSVINPDFYAFIIYEDRREGM